MPAIAALAYHRASGRAAVQPNQRLSYAENFLYMLDAGATPRLDTGPVSQCCSRHGGVRRAQSSQRLSGAGNTVSTSDAGAVLMGWRCPAREFYFSAKWSSINSMSCAGHLSFSCNRWPMRLVPLLHSFPVKRC